MGKTISPLKIETTTQELVDKIYPHILPISDPRSVFGFNLWFKQSPISVYMRQGRRVNKDTREYVYTLEIASIDVKTPKKGYFTSFLNQMEKVAAKRGLNILIENVHNEHLQEFLQRRGYSLYDIPGDMSGWPPTYWRI